MKFPLKLVGSIFAVVVLLAFILLFTGCNDESDILVESSEPEMVTTNQATGNDAKIIFLHHSTGEVIWEGGVPEWFNDYNAKKGTDYQISEQSFPKEAPYGWGNYPYDYWNIWVNHAGETPYQQEPTLEMLAEDYDVIAFKHCFPVSDIEEGYEADVSSPDKTFSNYKLQYEALKQKMREFPDTKFVVWTGAAQVKNATEPAFAQRAEEFFDWVINDWDETGDNIYIWDFRSLETEGGMYLQNKYAADPYDSHPNEAFAELVAPLFGQRLVSVIEGRGDEASITGQ